MARMADLTIYVVLLVVRVATELSGGSAGNLQTESSASKVPDTSGSGGELYGASIEQIIHALSLNLEREDQRGAEAVYSFREFQEMSDLNCHDRLYLLMNSSITFMDEVLSYNQEIMGVSALLIRISQVFPTENSWIWILQSARQRLLRKLHGYLARLASSALDKQECFYVAPRRILLDAILAWKALHIKSIAELWDGYAFGAFQGEVGVNNAESAIVEFDVWTQKLEAWINNLVVELHRAITLELPETLEEQGGAIRLHQDEAGMFVPYEYLRRKGFNQWALDKGLLRGLLRHVWKPQYTSGAPIFTLGDFGAGGGQYSTWLNETGLVQAFAFDGTKSVTEISGGSVQEINLISDVHLWRTFDWVMCLEVGEHIPAPHSRQLLSNLKRHAVRGLVMSWSDDWEGIGHVNCLARDAFVAFVELETGFQYDALATKSVEESCEIDYIARTIAIFRAV